MLGGEAGVGKTALLQYLVGRAAECRVVQTAGVEFAMELAFAGLHQLCVPLLLSRSGSSTPTRRRGSLNPAQRIPASTNSFRNVLRTADCAGDQMGRAIAGVGA